MPENRKKPIVFMGAKTIGFNCLNYLIKNRDRLNIKIAGVLTNTNKEANVKIIDLCKKHDIPFIRSLEEYMDLKDFDILISVQYHEILKQKHIEKGKQIAINLHLAPLPEYRGCNQFSYAIINNDKEFGVTLHQLDEGIDSGPIIAEKRFSIPKNCFVNNLHKIAVEKGKKLFEEKIKDIIDGNFELTPQKNFLKERKSSIHYRKEIKNLKKIDLSWSKNKIERYIRGTYMPNFEPPYTIINKKKIYFTENFTE